MQRRFGIDSCVFPEKCRWQHRASRRLLSRATGWNKITVMIAGRLMRSSIVQTKHEKRPNEIENFMNAKKNLGATTDFSREVISYHHLLTVIRKKGFDL
jgi:hypothetical protein